MAYSPTTRKLRLLLLGGTRWIGPHVVRAALMQGHHVAVFNRGNQNHVLPKDVECLIGDRDGDLKAIRARDWDAVVDLATFLPKYVRTLGEAIRDRVGHFTFISTLAVYKNTRSSVQIDENSSVLEYPAQANWNSLELSSDRFEYGASKVLCERESEVQFSRRTLTLRLGHLVGPGDRQGAFTFLPVRAQYGGRLLATGNPSMPIQILDVRDLAQNIVLMLEKSVTGIFNLAGPTTALSLGSRYEAVKNGSSCEDITWVPPSFLATRNDRELWSRLLFWTFESEGWATIMRMRVDRAIAHGLSTRPIEHTLADTLDWYRSLKSDSDFLLPARNGKTAYASTGKGLQGWEEYLFDERSVIAEWESLMRQPRPRAECPA